MKYHEIDSLGNIYIQQTETLPVWTSTDRRRIIFNFVNDSVYYADRNHWAKFLVQGDLDDHVNDLDNPHETTFTKIGAAPQSELDNHVNDLDNPHETTTTLIGAASQADLDNHVNDLDNPHVLIVGDYCTIYKWTSVGTINWKIPTGAVYIDITCVGGGKDTSGIVSGAAGNYSRTITSNITVGQEFKITVGDIGNFSSFGTICKATGANVALTDCIGDIKLQGGYGNIPTGDTRGAKESEGAASFFGNSPAPGSGCSTHMSYIWHQIHAKPGIVLVKVFHD